MSPPNSDGAPGQERRSQNYDNQHSGYATLLPSAQTRIKRRGALSAIAIEAATSEVGLELDQSGGDVERAIEAASGRVLADLLAAHSAAETVLRLVAEVEA